MKRCRHSFGVNQEMRKEYLLETGFTAFFISLFLPNMPVVTNLVIGILFVYCFFCESFSSRMSRLRRRPALLLLLLFYVLLLPGAVLSADRSTAIELLVRRLPLVIFPLSIGSIGIPPPRRRRILLLYSIVTTAFSLFCFIYSVIRTWRRQDWQWLYDDSLTWVIDRQSSFMAWMVTIAIVCFVDAIGGLKRKWPAFVCIGFLLVFHYLLASRAALFFLYFVALCWGGRQLLQTGRRRLALVLTATLVIAAAGMAMLFPKTLNRFRELQYTRYDFRHQGVESHYNMPVTKDQWNGANIRLAVWDCALAVAKRHWLTGIPIGDKQAALMAEYQARGFEFAYRGKRDSHNTYLDVLINTGIPGLVLFIMAVAVMPLTIAWRRSDRVSFLVIAALAVALLYEVWLNRNLGCLLLGFWLSLLAGDHSPLSRIYSRTASSVSPK
jgi:O-antigen ligase